MSNRDASWAIATTPGYARRHLFVWIRPFIAIIFAWLMLVVCRLFVHLLWFVLEMALCNGPSSLAWGIGIVLSIIGFLTGWMIWCLVLIVLVGFVGWERITLVDGTLHWEWMIGKGRVHRTKMCLPPTTKVRLVRHQGGWWAWICGGPRVQVQIAGQTHVIGESFTPAQVQQLHEAMLEHLRSRE